MMPVNFRGFAIAFQPAKYRRASDGRFLAFRDDRFVQRLAEMFVSFR
jgi:hypothetical protein